MQSVKIIREQRKTPLLKPTQFGCLKTTPSINITRGCIHSCVYCYARGFTDAPPLGEVHLYENLHEVLERELARKRKFPSWVSFSTASDAFQDMDEILEVAYRTIKMLLERGIGIAFLTKGFIPSEFIELFKRYPRLVKAKIGIVSLDEGYKEVFEPFSAHPFMRLSLLRDLISEGIDTSVRVDPLIPGITDSEESLEVLMKGLKDFRVKNIAVSYLVMRPYLMNQFSSELSPGLVNRIFGYYQGQSWQRVITSARTKLLPKAMRTVRYRRIKELARKYGIECSTCGCKNPDLPWESCNPWISEKELGLDTRQLSLFAF
jgi:DNA repair photolyase